MKAEYEYTPYSSLERIIEVNKDLYYLKLKEAQAEEGKGTKGLEAWIIFF